MDMKLAYYRGSRLVESQRGRELSFAPNLARDPVAFDAELREPVRFREAISALHDVVINDLRYKPRDTTDYDQWKKSEEQRLAEMRRETSRRLKADILAKIAEVPADLEQQYNKCRHRYWKARQEYSTFLLKHDHELWRKLMPCDPVVTVADDVVFFECFSADESSYGCLTVDREGGFGPCENVCFGTTNVDYSWDLYHHFQTLRTYRQTRFRVDPEGFEVATTGNEEYREEKIDLPPGWLRGFMQIQVAMGLPMRKVSLSREAVYSLLAWLKRHKARQSPRALRFELAPDAPPRLVLEPWEQPITSHGMRWHGAAPETVRIWGARRLLTLARLLPLAERFDVHLLGTGMPSFWVAKMGMMRLTLGLSGWTANDWTRGSALDLLAPPGAASTGLVARVSEFLRRRQAATLDEIRSNCLAETADCAVALNHLAHAGQVIYDLSAGRYRWRQIMPQALGEAEMGPENAELSASREIVARGRVTIASQQTIEGGLRQINGKADNKPVEIALSEEGMIRRGKCVCGHHRRAGIRMGACRHLLALRQFALQGAQAEDPSVRAWYERLRTWADN